MEAIVYSLKVAIFLIAFYLLYKSFMSRETFLRTNRIVLLASLVLSFVLPFCGLTVSQTVDETGGNYAVAQSVVMLEEVIVGSADVVHSVAIDWRSVAVFIYLAGIVVCILRVLVSMVRVMQLIRSGERVVLDNGIVLTIVDNRQAPFSWIKFIIISRADYEENKDEILTHERAHIRYRHSIDLLLCDALCCLQWFNPAIWLLRQELCAVHEYEADKAVLDSGINAKQYQILLIKKAVGGKWYSIANSFNHSKLKYRIAMMSRKKSSGWARAKVLYVLPVVAFAMSAFAQSSCTNDEGNNFGNSEFTYSQELYNSFAKGKFIGSDKDGNEVLLVKEADGSVRLATAEEIYDNRGAGISRPLENREIPEDEVFFITEKMPEFPGGELELRKFIAQNVIYPEDAKAKNQQGKDFVKFVIDTEGNVRDVELVRGTGIESLDNEAIRVVKLLPKWEPGMQHGVAVNVSYTVPINFELGKRSLPSEAVAPTEIIEKEE